MLAGKYRVERLLGAGGMGVVAACRHLDLNELRAVKFLLPEAKSETETVERFMREARAVVKMKNTHVVRVFDIGRFEGGEPYIVMEFLEGRDLKSVLDQQDTLDVDRALKITLQTLEAMAEAHSLGIVHRDLKPANIFLTSDLHGDVCVKVLDFGISKLLDPEDDGMEMTTTHALMGSPYYMSPEQMMSTRDVDARADIWSIGVVLYQMLAGRVPFRGKNIAAQCALLLQKDAPPPSTYCPAPLPDGLDEAVLGFLRRDIEARHRTVAVAADAIARFRGNDGLRAAKRVASVLRRSHRSVSQGELPWSDTAKTAAPSNEAIARAVVSDDALTISNNHSQSTRKSRPDPREAEPTEVMSQSTKASWQTINAESVRAEAPKSRRASYVVGAAVLLGVVLIGGVAAMRAATTTPAAPASSLAPPTTPTSSAAVPPAVPTATTPEATATAADTGTPSADPAVSSSPEAPSAEVPSAEAPSEPPAPTVTPAPRTRPAVPRPVAVPKPPPPPPPPDDPFKGREPIR